MNNSTPVEMRRIIYTSKAVHFMSEEASFDLLSKRDKTMSAPALTVCCFT
jgi:hypothetical protein